MSDLGMTTFDWVIFYIAWGCVPAVLIIKEILDWRFGKICRETQPEIDKALAELRKRK